MIHYHLNQRDFYSMHIIYLTDLLEQKIRIDIKQFYKQSSLTIENNLFIGQFMMIKKEVEHDGLTVSKRKQYEKKIMEFMGQDETLKFNNERLRFNNQSIDEKNINNKSSQYIQKKEKEKGREQPIGSVSDQLTSSKSISKDTVIKNINNMQSQERQSHLLIKHQPSLLRRKTSLLTTAQLSNSNIDNNSQNVHNHKSLLQKIQNKIQLINQKIAEQITKQENQLLLEYEMSLKHKQQLLNKLRLTTNQEMIRQKIIERKEQLRRERDSLIEGNVYYHMKLEEVKNQLNTLISNNQSHQHSLKMLIKNNNNKEQHQTNQSLIRKNKQKSFFDQSSNSKYIIERSKEDHSVFVERVLGKYNQKSNISLQHKDNKDSLHITEQSRVSNNHDNYQCILPKIEQHRNPTIMINSKSTHEVVKQQQNNDYCSYRKFNTNKFDRVRSIGVLEGGHVMSDINDRGDSQNKRRAEKKKNHAQMFNNSTESKNSIHHNSSNINNSKMINQRKKSIIKLIQQTQSTVQMSNNLLYTKQYLQQFVVKKITKQQSITPMTKGKRINPRTLGIKQKQKEKQRRKQNKRQELRQQLRKRIQQLQKPLMIQQLFGKIVYQYYNNNEKSQQQQRQSQEINNAMKTQQQTIDVDDELQYQQKYVQRPAQQQQNTAQKNEIEIQQKVIDCKKQLTLLQANQFDKRAVVEFMMKSTQFKRYLYQLIVEEFYPIHQPYYSNNNLHNSFHSPFQQQQQIINKKPQNYAMLNTANFKHLQGLLT